jgi:hypothetical protein
MRSQQNLHKGREATLVTYPDPTEVLKPSKWTMHASVALWWTRYETYSWQHWVRGIKLLDTRPIGDNFEPFTLNMPCGRPGVLSLDAPRGFRVGGFKSEYTTLHQVGSSLKLRAGKYAL